MLARLPGAARVYDARDTFPAGRARKAGAASKATSSSAGSSSTPSSSKANDRDAAKDRHSAKDRAHRAKLLEHVGVGATVALKPGAQVMLVKNAAGEAGAGLVNGSVGRVVGFWRPSEVLGTHVSNTTSGNMGMGMVRGVKMREDRAGPLVRVEGKENACGAGGEGEGEGEGEGKEEGKKRRKRKSAAEEELLPLVEFVMCGGSGKGAKRREGEHKEAVLVGREEFRVEDAEGKVVARRVQVRFSPLLPSSPLPPSFSTRPIANFHPHTDPAHPRLGDVHPQSTGADAPARESRPSARVRGGAELRRALARGCACGTAGAAFRPAQGACAPEGACVESAGGGGAGGTRGQGGWGGE
ncbi:hypothetical protein PLICRDRAFT_526031 [Plicaturopsis crispa FD-325 SS-3]|nr:hypothetical protein PLICRDRAFT_526031 [Plicaturopsis crispa FD-325 SS-3]